MRKLVFALMVLMAFNIQAQKKMNLTAEQAAELHTKEMTLRLELNEKQQKQVHALAEKQAKKREAMREARKEKSEMTSEQRYEAKIARLDSQIKIQKEMKAILNEQQFEQWKKGAQKREKAMRKKKSKHRERRHE
ncbi:MAG: hypothetical protein KUG51_00870 [Urechidicola sp.]|nr:hypothetical protein [Urechidicola sp.]